MAVPEHASTGYIDARMVRRLSTKGGPFQGGAGPTAVELASRSRGEWAGVHMTHLDRTPKTKLEFQKAGRM